MIMKKGLKLFTLVFALMFVALVKVNAEAITTWEDLKTCLTKTGTETCETGGKITAASENITVVGDKTLILGDTLTIANRLKIDSGTKLTVKGNVTTTGQYMFMAEAGSSLILESGVFTSTLKSPNSENGGLIVSAFGEATSGLSKTYIKVEKDVQFNDGGVAIFQDRATNKAAYGVVVDFYGKISMTKNGTVAYNSFTVLGNIKAMTGEDLPTINIYEGAEITNEGAPAIYGAGYAIWNIEGGEFTGSEALSIKAGKFNITGGTFVGNGEYVKPENVQAEGSASEPTGAAISITGNDGYAAGVELDIQNATVESKNGYAIFEAITKGSNPAVKAMNVYSGDYTGKVAAVYTKNVEDFIMSGTFSSDVSDYVSKDTDSKIVVVDGKNVVLSLQEIIVASDIKNGTVTVQKGAYKGDSVKLDIKPNDGYEVSEIKVYDVFDKPITVTNNTFTMVDSPVYVDVTFEEIKEEVKEEKNPNTVDNVSIFVIIGMLSLVAGAVAVNKLRKNA